MKTETLELAGPLQQEQAMNIAQALKAVEGVSRVAISTTSGRVTIDFEDGATSIQELGNIVQQAGQRVRKEGHAERGMCCGSCGG